MNNACDKQSGDRFITGDRWCVIGDSITHHGIYHCNVYLFYATRFPTQMFELFNCGTSGCSAQGTLNRFAKDVEPRQPTVASIMLGMNDIARENYPDINERTQKRYNAIDRYETNMRQVISRLRNLGARLILITPSIFDQTAVLTDVDDPYPVPPGTTGCNDGLSLAAERVRQLAAENRATLIDFHEAMQCITTKQQKHDPSFTLVGKDRVHPGPVGHMVMTHIFLEAQNAPPEVSSIIIDAANGNAAKTFNGKLAELHASPSSVSFTFTANALPYPVAQQAIPALEIIPFTEKFNQELLQIQGLEQGNYELLINDFPIAQFTSDNLAKGVNLAELNNTPQYRQAVEVQELNDKRHNITAERLRDLSYIEHNFMRNELPDINDLDSVATVLNNKLATIKQTPVYSYTKTLCEKYLVFKPVENETRQTLEELCERMWKAALPGTLFYSLRRIT